MASAVAVLGVLGAVMAALAATVFISGAALIVPIFVIGVAVFLIAQRSAAGIVASLGLLALAVLSAMGLVGFITTKNGGGLSFGIAEDVGRALAVTAALAVPAAATFVLWYDPIGMTLRYVGLACAALGAILAFVFRAGLTTQTLASTWIVAILCLGSALCAVPFFTTQREPRPRAATAAMAERAEPSRRVPK